MKVLIKDGVAKPFDIVADSWILTDSIRIVIRLTDMRVVEPRHGKDNPAIHVGQRALN